MTTSEPHQQNILYAFGEYRLNPGRRELSSSDGASVTLKPKCFDVLSYLVNRRGTLVTKGALMRAIWPNAVVEENTLTQAISAIRHALGDSARNPRYIATVPGKGFQFIADVEPVEDIRRARERRSDSAREPSSGQVVRFCTSRDGVRLAYAISGEGPPLVRTAHWLSHLEHDWTCPVYRHLLRDLSRDHQLIRYDNRGNGLSDWHVEELTLETFVSDLESVVDSAGVSRFALLGMSMGVPVSIVYALRHPDRVSHLVLYGGSSSPLYSEESAEAMALLVKSSWGQSNPAMRQMFTTLLMPDSTLEEQQSLNELQRLSAAPENAARMVLAIHRMEVAHLLGRVEVQTLVFHVRDDATVPPEAGRRIAASIPGARFVLLEGRNHILLEHDASTARFKRELLSFIAT